VTERTPEQWPERHLTPTITEINLLIAKTFNRRVRALGVTRAQWQALFWLSRRDGLTQTELAELLVIARPPLGKIVDRLEAEGWVERRPDQHDRRIKRLFTTDKVQPLLEPAQAVVVELGEASMRGMDAEERAQLMRLLLRMRENLGAIASE
jgi:DNA-binding MarR family transcriptional regulator|tara:strand:- start:290 stop:745 length:456 start_codon:yes stop_codon:yes gene_type:complete